MEKVFVFFLLKHLASGAAGGVTLGVGLLAFDVANLQTLVFGTDHGLLGAALLFFGLMMTFGSVAVAAGIMSLGSCREDRKD